MSEATNIAQNRQIFYFCSGHTKVEGKSSQRYRCFDATENLELTANAFRSSRPTSVYFKDEEEADVEMQIRKSFPFTGKIDIRDARSGSLLGVTTRSRKFFDADGNKIGEFHDSTTWREHLGESLADFIDQVVFDSGPSHTSNASTGYVYFAEKKPAATLVRQTLPFFPESPKRTEPHPVGKALKKVLPKNLGSALFDITPPLGWKLEILDTEKLPDLKLMLCATLMTLEVRRWAA